MHWGETPAPGGGVGRGGERETSIVALVNKLGKFSPIYFLVTCSLSLARIGLPVQSHLSCLI